MQNTSLAMVTKAKAMFGSRLKKADFETLAQKKSISEIATYLKNDTYFRIALKGVNEQSVHRGHLEAMVRKDLYYRFSSLVRYSQASNSEFYRYGVVLNEINQILEAVRGLMSEDRLVRLSKLPMFIEKKMNYSLQDLAKTKSYQDILEVTEKTDYYDILKRYEVTDLEELDFTALDFELHLYYYDKIASTVKKELKGKRQEEILEVFNMRIELANITKIYRSKKYFNLSSEEIMEMLTPVYVKIPKKTLTEWIQKCDAEEFLENFKNSYYKKYINENSKIMYIEDTIKMIDYRINYKNMIYSSSPNLVLISYMVLAEIEIQNVVDIIEGVRYGISADKIISLLIY